ncbi:flavodoxin family protein [Tepidibacter formicigenes]|uniref:NADPH-dependent FMN reductase n=1 Tax=Tepidibacter formicigenes DSM 15518 TaxID=1123349 RepID=A0A1M6MJU5_9FIRM|nr:NAD(P)H-dependent oxidoreductase [Tepidibacter formicigenes]SHJ83664.1 NADPH-dependent FMN reductase [Tepidibacter formicigenes DSM 15518]
MDNLYIIMPGNVSKKFSSFIENVTQDIDKIIIKDIYTIPDLKNKKILFAVELDECGFNISLFELFSKLYKKGNNSLLNSKGIIIIKSPNELYTKSVSQNIIFLANQIGCSFIGHPIVEATGNLNNLLTWQKRLNMSLENIQLHLSKKLVKNFIQKEISLINKPKILALHASSHKTSNTLMLWKMTKKHLLNCSIKEFHVENGTITDCKGCSYITCKHYSENNSCFYGGVITKELLPIIEKADCIVWICPNYNDAISAKLMAVINRMTVLYRRTKFYDKTFFSIIVSGNSGSDSVAKQLIGALNINKGFRLPPYFSLIATANDPGSIKKVYNIEEKAKKFANHILKEIKK